MTSASAWKLVREAFQTQALPKEATLALYGFQSIPPLQQTTLECACDKIIEISEGTPKAKCIKVACADAKKEMDSAQMGATELSKNANQRIGILVPELNSAVQPTARTISEALAQYNCPTDVNISAGVSLK